MLETIGKGDIASRDHSKTPQPKFNPGHQSRQDIDISSFGGRKPDRGSDINTSMAGNKNSDDSRLSGSISSSMAPRLPDDSTAERLSSHGGSNRASASTSTGGLSSDLVVNKSDTTIIQTGATVMANTPNVPRSTDGFVGVKSIDTSATEAPIQPTEAALKAKSRAAKFVRDSQEAQSANIDDIFKQDNRKSSPKKDEINSEIIAPRDGQK